MSDRITPDDAKTRLGGDLWNDSRVARIVFHHFPEAGSFTIKERVSGLYCHVTLENGSVWRVLESGRMWLA